MSEPNWTAHYHNLTALASELEASASEAALREDNRGRDRLAKMAQDRRLQAANALELAQRTEYPR